MELVESERRSERRQALVAAAYQRIAIEGFEGLRTRDVAADVGLNIATLHYYYPTKESLIRGVIGHAMQRFQATMPTDGSPGPAASEALARAARAAPRGPSALGGDERAGVACATRRGVRRDLSA